ncbi:MAG: GNAT family N-acetyltransferase [Chloroflexi bacterium]|nr:GNAT family N-acetyltransferase [Chloroflexota bacterium]
MRRFREGDEKLILQLRHVIRGDTHSTEYWRWRYLNNPAGRAIMWLAVADGIAVGHSAMIPTLVKIGDTSVRGGLAVDNWTHPDFRRQGIFFTLHTKILEDAAREGIQLAYTFPNQLSYPGFMKLKYSDLFPVPSMRKVVNWVLAAEARIKVPLIQTVTNVFSPLGGMQERNHAVPEISVREVPSFDGRFDEFWTKVSRQYNVLVVRDSRYLNWRYAFNPRYRYRMYVAERGSEILGYVVLNCTKADIMRGFVADLLVLPDEEDALRALVGKCIESSRAQRVATLHCWMLERAHFHNSLLKMGFRERSSSPTFCGRVLANLPSELVRHPDNWWLCPGDYDS